MMMHQLREGLPALRNLNIQFGKTWVPVQYHMVPIHQGLGECAEMFIGPNATL